MTSTDPLLSWKETWSAGAVPDIDALRREAARKRQRMRIFVSFELAATAIASLIVLQALFQYHRDVVTAAVLVGALTLVIGTQCLALRLRRGTWRSVADTLVGWLHLLIRRARISLRLIVIQAWAILIAILSAFWFVVHQWLLDGSAVAHVRLSYIVALNVVANTVVLLPMAIWAVRYAARQRRKIRDAEIILRELKE